MNDTEEEVGPPQQIDDTYISDEEENANKFGESIDDIADANLQVEEIKSATAAQNFNPTGF